MRNSRGRNMGRHSSYINSGANDARNYLGQPEDIPAVSNQYEEIAPPIYTGPLPVVPDSPEGIAPPIYTGPLPVVPTGPQIQPPRPTGPVRPTGPQIQPPRPTGPVRPTGPQIQPPRPTGPVRPTGPQIQPPRPQPPRPQPPRPQPNPQPPAYYIPPYGDLPRLPITLRSDQSLGVGDCLAPSSAAAYGPQLEEFIRQELRLYLSFTAWADRYPSRRTALRDLAEENLGRAKILLRAYSFITDEYYWPTYLTPLVSFNNYSREMRQLYNVVNTLEQSYLSAYRRTLDSCLASVYLALADRTQSQKQRMSRVL